MWWILLCFRLTCQHTISERCMLLPSRGISRSSLFHVHRTRCRYPLGTLEWHRISPSLVAISRSPNASVTERVMKSATDGSHWKWCTNWIYQLLPSDTLRIDRIGQEQCAWVDSILNTERMSSNLSTDRPIRILTVFPACFSCNRASRKDVWLSDLSVGPSRSGLKWLENK